LFGVIFALIEGQRYDWGQIWGWISIPEIGIAGGVLLATFLIYQWRRQDGEPLLPFAVFKDRNFTLMTLVMVAMGFAILGFFLPLTIYMQSVLGLTALQAGLTIAAQPLAMMVSSGVASSLVQKVSGKWLLIPGLVLFGAGVAYIDFVAQADSSRWAFLPGLIISGLGMGCVWTPVFSLATRNLDPKLAGVASGVINTMQELGTVVASAVVGAFLQNRLATALHDQAVARSAQLPAEQRARFVDGFSHAARNGFEVGAGQTGAGLQLSGVPANVVQMLQDAAHFVFTHAFVDAMRPTLVLPMVIIAIAAAGTFFVRADKPAAEAQRAEEKAAVA
jgi:MFS family permease